MRDMSGSAPKNITLKFLAPQATSQNLDVDVAVVARRLLSSVRELIPFLLGCMGRNHQT